MAFKCVSKVTCTNPSISVREVWHAQVRLPRVGQIPVGACALVGDGMFQPQVQHISEGSLMLRVVLRDIAVVRCIGVGFDASEFVRAYIETIEVCLFSQYSKQNPYREDNYSTN